jgi:hypothetical protein
MRIEVGLGGLELANLAAIRGVEAIEMGFFERVAGALFVAGPCGSESGTGADEVGSQTAAIG